MLRTPGCTGNPVYRLQTRRNSRETVLLGYEFMLPQQVGSDRFLAAEAR
jgi:hypothetical protein